LLKTVENIGHFLNAKISLFILMGFFNLFLFYIPGSSNVIADKEKVYNRQFSAPVLKRRSSGRFGLGESRYKK